MRADEPATEAARWYARLMSGHASESERQACARWRAAHPDHDRAFRHLDRIWQATVRLPAPELRAILLRRDRPSTAWPRRRFGLGLAALCTAALGGTAAVRLDAFGAPEHTLSVAVGPGQRRTVALPDGSLLEANTRTDISVRYYAGRRCLDLVRGECYLQVARHDPRPFEIRAGNGVIAAEHADLQVRVLADHWQVHLAAGQAEVAWGPWWRRRDVTVAAGQGLTIAAEAASPAPRPIVLDAVLAWRQGRLAFQSMPLAEVVDEINRYLVWPAWLDAPALQAHPVTGVLNTDDPQALVDALPRLAPVQVYRLPDGQPRIIAR